MGEVTMNEVFGSDGSACHNEAVTHHFDPVGKDTGRRIRSIKWKEKAGLVPVNEDAAGPSKFLETTEEECVLLEKFHPLVTSGQGEDRGIVGQTAEGEAGVERGELLIDGVNPKVKEGGAQLASHARSHLAGDDRYMETALKVEPCVDDWSSVAIVAIDQGCTLGPVLGGLIKHGLPLKFVEAVPHVIGGDGPASSVGGTGQLCEFGRTIFDP